MPPSKSPQTLAIMAEVRETAATFTEIAERYGITRERVRQIAKAAGIVGIPRKKERSKAARVQKRYTVGYRHHDFVRAVNRALALIGCRYCAGCRKAVELDLMGAGRARNCKACNTARTNAYYHNGGGKAKLKEWKNANREACNAYQRAYYRRKNARPGE